MGRYIKMLRASEMETDLVARGSYDPEEATRLIFFAVLVS